MLPVMLLFGNLGFGLPYFTCCAVCHLLSYSRWVLTVWITVSGRLPCYPSQMW
jgi:hypothetical protein